jgi:hypothetical protein
VILKFTAQPRTKHKLDRVARRGDYCPHTHVVVVEEERKVVCSVCEKEIDPIDALLMISRNLWWQNQAKERELELEEKRVSKVQAAALACLYRAGIGPEQYRIRWEKQHAEAATAVAIEPAAPVAAISEETAS